MTAEVAEVLPFQSKLTAAFVTVTPEMAERWLARNTKNRRVRQNVVDRYQRDMLAGKWRLDGSPIRFAAEGTLLDGQHRLAALIAANVTLTLLVVRGVAPEAQAIMGTGRKRSAGDALAIAGFSNYANLAATARFAILCEAGRIAEDGGGYEVSHEEVLAYISANPDLTTACDFIVGYARKTDCRPTVVIYTYFVMRRLDEQGAAEFWIGVAEKAGLDKNNPILVLSNRLAQARRNREILTNRVLLSMIYRAWNAKREGRDLQFLPVHSRNGVVPIPKPH